MAALFALQLGALAVTSALNAQTTPAAASSPLRPCCQPSAGSMVLPHATPLARDTLPSVGRVLRQPGGIGDALPVRLQGIALTASTSGGTLRRPQQPARADVGEFRAEGARRGAWRTAGGARYRRGREADVAWRNGSDAYLGNAYLWADSVGGDYRRDELALDGGVETPSWHGLRAALGLDWGLGQGARRNDPRPLFRRRVAELAPALTLSRGAHTVAAGAIVGWQREDLEIGGGSSTEFPVLFRLRGIGTFDRTQLISGQRSVLGSVMGGQGAWAWGGTRWALAFGGAVRVERDSVRDGIATPTDGGATRRLRTDWRLLARRTGARGGVEVDANAAREEGRGRDPVFAAINAIDEGRRESVHLAWWHGGAGARPLDARWRLDLTLSAHTLSREDIAAETAFDAATRSIMLGGTRRVAFGGGALTVSGAGILTAPENSALTIARPSRITSILARDDHTVLTARQRGMQGVLTWERRLGAEAMGRIRVDGIMLTTPDGLRTRQWRLTFERS
ncbi:MAG TPA: hypothetical protein VE869_01315 [Gemmatimonas sp.]|nr:hypothetical protein [Gemmatimonas sp.]